MKQVFTAVLLIIVLSRPSFSQPNIIINEFSQGNNLVGQEWIELVVTENGTDIQGVYFTTSNVATDYSVKSVQLKKISSVFSSVNQGARIVIYNSGVTKDATLPADDIDFSDGLIVIPDNNTTFLESGASWPGFRDQGENIGLLTDAGVGIHAVSYGTTARIVLSSLFGPGSWGQVVMVSTSTVSQSLYYTQQSSGQAGNSANWAIRTYDSATPGSISETTDDRGSSPPAVNMIINEFSQGDAFRHEWIELVVTADATNIQGVYFTIPPSTDYTDYSVKSVQLSTTNSDFSNVSKGSIIVIYNAGNKDASLPADDTNFLDDGVIVIPHNNTTFIENGTTATFPNIRDQGDNIGLLTSGGVGIHAISYGGDPTRMTVSSLFGPGTWGQIMIPNVVGSNQSAHYSEGTDGQAGNSANWVVTTDVLATPGALNGGNNGTLPVELSSFSLSVINTGVKLNWRTETEVSNYGFDIERKSSTTDWLKMGFVQGNGNSNSPKDYTFVDANTNEGKYFYRLKQIDTDGKFNYSKIIEVELGSQVQYGLSQNFPNPFNPVTTIKFQIPEAGKVKLSLYNILGQEVKTLINEYKQAGVHLVNFNASELNSGIYIYKIFTDKYTATRKMILLK